MSDVTIPKIDKRRFSDHLDILMRTTIKAGDQTYQGARGLFTPEWTTTDAHDHGVVMSHLFGRLMDVLVERLNRIPEKHLIAFLNMLGVDRRAGNPARVPVTFTPAPKSPGDRFVPQGTQVATTQSEAAPAVIFETEEGMNLTTVTLDYMVSIDSAGDSYIDVKKTLADAEGAPVPVLLTSESYELVPHALYLSHEGLFSTTSPFTLHISVKITRPAVSPLSLSWERYDGKKWVPLLETTGFDVDQIFEIVNFVGTEKSTVKNVEAHWVRCRLNTALIQTGDDLPEVRDIKVSSSVPTDIKVPADAVFVNTSPVDLNRNFYPFGEKPAIDDTFYVKCDEAFSLADPGMSKTVTLHFKLSPIPGKDKEKEDAYPDLSKAVTVAWEYWSLDERRWKVIPVEAEDDTSNQFRGPADAQAEPFYVRFKLPTDPVLGRVEVNGIKGYWIRAKITDGNYGTEAILVLSGTTAAVETYEYTPSSFRPPYLSSTDFEISYQIDVEASYLPLDACVCINNFEITHFNRCSEKFEPFLNLSASSEVDHALYLGYSNPFGHNRRISQLFDLALPAAEQPISRESEPAPQMVWEYFSATDEWRRLDVKDGTLHLLNTGIVAFTVPADMAKCEKFFAEAYWIRVRLDTGVLNAPRNLKGIYPNTVWARSVRTVCNEVLGSGTGEIDLRLQLSHLPVLPGERLLVREANLPSDEEINELIALEQDYARELGIRPKEVIVRQTDTISGKEEIWVRWYPRNNFLSSSVRSRHYVIDRVTGQVTFASEKGGMPVPLGKDNIKVAWYQANTAAGATGTGAAGLVKELKSTLPFVSKVGNKLAAAGAADVEDMTDVKRRGPKTLKHRNRAVTVEDFDALALESSTRIALVKTLSTTNAALETELGSVTVIIVPESNASRPVPSAELIAQVRTYIRNRAAETVYHRVDVIGPAYVEVAVFARIVTVDPSEASVVAGRVTQALEAFLHPLTGGCDSKGWPFGRNVYISEIYAVIEDVEGVDYVINAEFIDSMNAEEVEVGANQLVSSGTHRIIVGAAADV